MKRWFWIILFAVAPFLRKQFWNPHQCDCGKGDTEPRQDRCPKCFHYTCWSCNQPSCDHAGYSGYSTAAGAELCKRCWTRRRRWNLLSWLETGERVELPAIDGDGVVSPSTSRSTYTAKVYRLFGFEFVAAGALRHSLKSLDGARYWFDRLGVNGNSEQVRKIVKARELEEGDRVIRELMQ